MRILIVDDELLVRIGIKSCIQWQEYGMEIVGEASDGLEAMNLLYLLKPDVMLLDLKMPNMDGIELMQKMKKEKILCKVLILSGFDDIYHVKEAMRLGAMDYFHKPCMSSEDILKTLLSLKDQIEEETDSSRETGQSSDYLEKNKHILREAFLRELVEGRYSDNESFIRRCREVGTRLENRNFHCILFSIQSIEEIEKRYENNKSNPLQASVSNIINGIFSMEAGVEFFVYDKNTFVAITSSGQAVSEKRVIEGANSIIELISDAMQQFLNVEVILGISDLHTTCGEIKAAFEEAVKAMKYKFFKKDLSVIHYRDIKRSSDREALMFVDTLTGKMKDALSKHDFIHFEGVLEEFVCFLEEQPCLSEEDVKKLFNGFLFLVREGKAYRDEMERINSCESIRQLKGIWEELLREKLEGIKKAVQFQKCSFLIKNIISFIEDNFYQEITLNFLSKQFNVSPNYISRLFKEETGETLFNYINAVRVEKAKSFLKDIDLKVYEVSERAGFKSPVHFNIVFNKYTGLTPKQYRDSL
ncbi:MAG: response regulator [Clostridia bacterium]|nr:response regulator [Clostridia bacterium]